MVKQRTAEELEAGLKQIRQSPKDNGVLALIARRPRSEEREVLETAEISLVEGLVGDNWKTRGSTRTADGSAHPEMQITLMNARVIALVAGEREHWAIAGDQLYIDLDMSARNVPPGTRLSIGSAIIEVTSHPHTGCKKFAARFGAEATKFVNSPLGRELQLRGINARVINPGVVKTGDVVRKCSSS